MASLVAPDGHVFDDAGVVAQDLDLLARSHSPNPASGEEDRNRAKGATRVEVLELASRLGLRSFHNVSPSSILRL